MGNRLPPPDQFRPGRLAGYWATLQTLARKSLMLISQMRVDPKGTIAGYPAVLVRDTLRRVRVRVQWDLETLEAAARLPAGQGPRLVEALVADGLVEVSGKG